MTSVLCPCFSNVFAMPRGAKPLSQPCCCPRPIRVTNGGTDDSPQAFQGWVGRMCPQAWPRVSTGLWEAPSGRGCLDGASPNPICQHGLDYFQPELENLSISEGGTQTGEAMTSLSFGHEERWLKHQHFPLAHPKASCEAPTRSITAAAHSQQPR